MPPLLGPPAELVKRRRDDPETMSFSRTIQHALARLAIPGIIRIVAGFHALTFLLIYFNPTFREFLVLDPSRILDGEVWRLVSWIFIPRTLSLIWIIFAVMFLVFVGDGLEQVWGVARLNAYFWGGVVLINLAAFVLPLGSPWLSATFGEFLFTSLLLAFAINYPETEIRLFLILPIKMKWVGALAAAGVVFYFIQAPEMRLPILVCLGNFFLYAVPLAVTHLRQRGSTAVRRAKFKGKQLPETEAFHRCSACGKTDTAHPALEFRVADDDEEYCLPCLEKKRSPVETS
ncbi:hypothetical protein BH23VER1_BH23VER1_33350 [soil metagenome]